MTPAVPRLLHLRAGRRQRRPRRTGDRLPRVLHWGADLGDVGADELAALRAVSIPPLAPGSTDAPVPVSVLPEQSLGWLGTPGVTGHRDGADFSVAFTGVEVTHAAGAADGVAHRVRARPGRPSPGWTCCSRSSCCRPGCCAARDAHRRPAPAPAPAPSPAPGTTPTRSARSTSCCRCRRRRTRCSTSPAGTCASARRSARRSTSAPGCARAARPRAPRRHHAARRRPAGFGYAVRRGVGRARRLVAATPARSPSGRRAASACSAAASCCSPARSGSAPGESYASPWVYGSYGDGLDELAGALPRLPARPGRSTRAPRGRCCSTCGRRSTSTTTSTGCAALADRAAAIGVERYVLDDGWFRGRRDDTAGLGDWYVDDDGVAGRARARSSTTSAGSACSSGCGSSRRWSTRTPTWPARTRTGCCRPAAAWRRRPATSRCSTSPTRTPTRYVLERIDAILTEYPIDYVKWDHNRDLIDAGHRPTGRAGVHEQTLADLPAHGRAARRAPRTGDRVLRRRRRPRRPRHHGAHRAHLGVRHASTPSSGRPSRPARAAAAAGDGRLAHRRADRAHHRPHARPRVPGRHRVLLAPRHRVGPHPPPTTPTSAALATWIAAHKRAPRRCCTAGPSCTPTPRPGALGARRGRPGRAARRSSRS